MNTNKLKLIVAVMAVLPLLVLGNSALASEVTGNLSTGIGGTVTVIDGIVMVSPTASPAGGTFTSAQSVTLAANGALSIHYTVDGSTPTCSNGTVYSGAISVNSTQSIKSISCYQTNHSSTVTVSGYVINLTVNSNQISSLINSSDLALPSGATSTSTPSLQAMQSITISDTTGSTVTIPSGTIITTVSGQNFDATALTASTPASGTLSGLTSGAVIDGSLQWGIVNLGLQFSSPITLSIYVGSSFNGQTLTIVRSTSASSGWTSDGIVSPATCVVSAGFCTFNATKASYYAAYTVTSTSTGGNTGGSSNSTPTPTPTIKVGDANRDNKVDKYDFSLMMANWGATGANVCDFNGDNKVDKYDFALLMSKWGL
ncbi:MAG: chitobiase/beta-hexosaminidase C-terminal domain-containing protein [Candidatus Staskawiczbacteria bacterium]|nr:chitobiase/beta-hexosaminidase C-terminal domain-containing protein [Candidatus Staskawiczbacteria bacterium]